jgi:hypothetical protein
MRDYPKANREDAKSAKENKPPRQGTKRIGSEEIAPFTWQGRVNTEM